MTRLSRFAPIACVLLWAAGCDAAPPATAPAAPQPQALATQTIMIHGTPFTLQVADEEAERQTGLMYTRSMPPDRGMVFVFPTERPLSFWMHNTPIDLDIIYADHDGKVVAVRTMHAYDETNVPSDEPATFAIELNAGAATKLGVKAGDRIPLTSDLTKSVK